MDNDRWWTPLEEAAAVAVVGASPRAGSLGRRVLETLVASGFSGQILPVNPNYRKVLGYPSFASLKDLSEAPAVVYVVVEARAVGSVVADAVEIGVSLVVISSAGFSEEGASGKVLEEDLGRQVRGTATRLIGPNSEGVIHLGRPLALSLGSAAARGLLVDGTGAVLSQSGSIGAAMARHLSSDGAGVRLFVSSGNEIDLSVEELLVDVLQRDDIDQIGLFIEDSSDPVALRRCISAASETGRHVIAMHGGVTATGAVAARSHTGRIVGDAEVTRAALIQGGAVVVDDLVTFRRVVSLLTHSRVARGRSVGVVALSGGARPMISDHLASSGLHLARFSPDTTAQLDAALPDFAATDNPVDTTGAVITNPSLVATCVEAVATDVDVDVVLVQMANSGVDPLLQWVSSAEKPSKPVLISLLGDEVPSEVDIQFKAKGALAFPGWKDALHVYERIVSVDIDHEISPIPTQDDSVQSVNLDPFDWQQVARLFADFHIATPQHVALEDDRVDEAVVERITFPIVAKPCRTEVDHKAAHGLVEISLRDPDQAQEALLKLRAQGATGKLMLQTMILGGEELLVTVRKSQSAMSLTIGSGGAAVEVSPDVVTCLLPVGGDYLTRAFLRTRAGLRIQARFGAGGVRTTVDLVDHLARLVQNTSGVRTIELNPAIVCRDGAYAVDALIEVI